MHGWLGKQTRVRKSGCRDLLVRLRLPAQPPIMPTFLRLLHRLNIARRIELNPAMGVSLSANMMRIPKGSHDRPNPISTVLFLAAFLALELSCRYLLPPWPILWVQILVLAAIA